MKTLRITAALAASALLLTSEASPVFLPTAVYAEETASGTPLPEWVPDSYNTALRFFNLHGGTFIQDGLLCVTFCRSYAPEAVNTYTTSVTGTAMEEVSHTLYESPAKDSPAGCNDIEVFVYRPVSAGSFSASISAATESAPEYYYQPPSDITYEFTVDEALTVTETDIFVLVPDCSAEFEAYFKEKGTLSFAGSSMVFCLRTAPNMFSEWKEGYVSDNVKLTARLDCSARTQVTQPGMTGYSGKAEVYVYEAVSEGPVEVRWDVVDINHPDSIPRYSYAASYEDAALTKPSLAEGDARIRISDFDTGEPVILDADTGFAIHRRASVTDSTTLLAALKSNPCVVPELCSNYTDTLPVIADALGFRLVPPDGWTIPRKGTSNVNADEHITITIVNNNAYDIEYRVRPDLSGDANGDGSFSTADLVTLEKWLLGMPDAELKNWKACDLCNDNMIDTFDLCLMRKALAESLKPEPVILMMADERRSHMTAAGLESYDRIVTFDTEDLAGMEEILTLIEKVSSNAEKYADMKPERLPYSVADYGHDALYIYCRSSGSEPQRLLLCTYGETCTCLPDDDVKQLAALMIEKGLFADKGAEDIYR